MGRPMAITEPKAMIRMTMAKPSPSASEFGGSNSAKIDPPISTRRPSMSATCSVIASSMASRISTAFSAFVSAGSSMSA